MDEKSYKNYLVNNISYNAMVDDSPLRIRFDQIDRFIRVYDGTRYLYYLEVKKINSFSTRLCIL